MVNSNLVLPILQVRDILTRYGLDKLIFKTVKGDRELTEKKELHSKLYKLIKERNLDKKFKDKVKIELNTNLMQKIAVLKNYISNTTLRGLIIRLEKEYIDSVLESDKIDPNVTNVTDRFPKELIDILFDIYDNTHDNPHVNSHTQHKCNFRWFEFKKQIQPCIAQTDSILLISYLSLLYKEKIQLPISDDCTQNAYHLLNYIYTNNIPQPERALSTYVPRPLNQSVASRPLNKPSNVSYVGLYDFLVAIEDFVNIKSLYRKTRRENPIVLNALKQLAEKFNNLFPKAAYVFATFDNIYRNKDCKNLRFHQTIHVEKDNCMDALDSISLSTLRNYIRISSNYNNPGDQRGLEGMQIDSFYEKVKNFNDNYTFRTEKTVKYDDNDYQPKSAGTQRNTTRRLNITNRGRGRGSRTNRGRG